MKWSGVKWGGSSCEGTGVDWSGAGRGAAENSVPGLVSWFLYSRQRGGRVPWRGRRGRGGGWGGDLSRGTPQVRVTPELGGSSLFGSHPLAQTLLAQTVSAHPFCLVDLREGDAEQRRKRARLRVDEVGAQRLCRFRKRGLLPSEKACVNAWP